MKISGLQKTSLNDDYPGKISAVVFTSGCNYQCPSCHAKKIIDGEEKIGEKIIFDYLNSKKGWIDAVVVCGGEPTAHLGLPMFLEKVKNLGLLTKLDTNGSNFAVLEELNRKKLVDYAAMDVKGPPEIYATLAGKEFIDDRDGYRKAIWNISMFPDYEFRTTIVPVARKNGKIEFMTPKEIGETARLIYDCTGSNEHKYYLQKFVARGKEEMLDERFSIESLPKEMHETPDYLIEKCLKEAMKYLPNSKIRGYDNA